LYQVCGEPCEQQICVACLAPNKKSDIVDFIMGRTLSEIDLTSVDIAERLIALACHHVFTVETLDGHCHMSEYYEMDNLGAFKATKAPPIKYQVPPVCPTCRGPISARRYGRITKRANLDILEQNVASTMSKSLEMIAPDVEAIISNIKSLQSDAKHMKFKPTEAASEKFDDLVHRRNLLFGKEDEPLSASIFDRKAMIATHGFDRKEAQLWIEIVRNLLKAFEKVISVATTRGPHTRAYEAALSTLYRLELSAIAQDPLRACLAPEPLAMDEVNKKIGQPPHKADTRFQVEAFFLSLEVRYMLAQIAQSRVEGLPTISNDHFDRHHRLLWQSFIKFIYNSCVLDSHKALMMAQRSSASRLAARSAMQILRADLEQFRHDIISTRDELIRTGEWDNVERSKLVSRVQEQEEVAREFLRTSLVEYIRSGRSTNMEMLKEDRTWFTENCRDKATNYIREYGKLEEYLQTDSDYQRLSLQEKSDIVKAFGFCTCSGLAHATC
jgi:hypothetical protein